ncbi:MAG: LptF/LptG family permease, partial [Caulobacteraceae bacterium]
MRRPPLRILIYLLVRTLAGVGVAFAVVASVIVLVVLVDMTRTLGAKVELGFPQLIELTLLKAPGIVLLLLPFVFLFGSMAAFIALNRRSELVALRAAGVSAWRFIAPAAAASFVIGLLTVTVLNP